MEKVQSDPTFAMVSNCSTLLVDMREVGYLIELMENLDGDVVRIEGFALRIGMRYSACKYNLAPQDWYCLVARYESLATRVHSSYR